MSPTDQRITLNGKGGPRTAAAPSARIVLRVP